MRTILPAAGLLVLTATAVAANITGTITDRTTGKPSAGDTVAVINTAKGMDELVKVTSDSQGRFHADAPDGGQILLHVTHAGAEYFKSVPPNTTDVGIDVYDSAKKIDGISGEALVLRVETDASGKTLNVVENFFVQNASAPPRTEFGANTFDFYLPKGAVVSQSLATSTSGLPTNTDVKNVDAANGHYAFTFPVRPGDTRFQVAYSLPYSGRQEFAIKLSVPTGDVAVMLPKTMKFEAISQFQPINPEPSAQSFDAHTPPFAQPVAFTLSGAGQLPQTQGVGQGGSETSGAAAAQAPAASAGRPGGGLGAPGDPEATNDPWSKYKWWIVGAMGLALAAGAGLLLKSGAPAGIPTTAALPVALPEYADEYPTPPISAASSRPTSLLEALKDELFELERDRLAGKLTEAQYAEHKAAFDIVLRRAISRMEAAPPLASS